MKIRNLTVASVLVFVFAACGPVDEDFGDQFAQEENVSEASLAWADSWGVHMDIRRTDADWAGNSDTDHWMQEVCGNQKTSWCWSGDRVPVMATFNTSVWIPSQSQFVGRTGWLITSRAGGLNWTELKNKDAVYSTVSTCKAPLSYRPWVGEFDNCKRDGSGQYYWNNPGTNAAVKYHRCTALKNNAQANLLANRTRNYRGNAADLEFGNNCYNAWTIDPTGGTTSSATYV